MVATTAAAVACQQAICPGRMGLVWAAGLVGVVVTGVGLVEMAAAAAVGLARAVAGAAAAGVAAVLAAGVAAVLAAGVAVWGTAARRAAAA